jgi:hypothetical protein
MAAKRAPGGGRKPKGEFSGLSGTPVNLRMPHDMRVRLDEASKDSGRNLTQEVLYRLEKSFDRDRLLDRDPASFALADLLERVIEIVKANLRIRRWRNDPFAFRTVKLAFNQILDALEPRGEIVQPKWSEDSETGEAFWLWFVPGSGHFSTSDTPEGAADFTANVIRMQLEDETETRMAAIRRALTIKPRGNEK